MPAAKQSVLVSALALVAVALMVAAYFTPIWWVSLTAPNYPPDAFPDGIRLHFHFTGVKNGCISLPKSNRIAQETQQEDLGWKSDQTSPGGKDSSGTSGIVDCVNEMNTINHYVGMKPIGVGAPVERLLGGFIVGLFAVMLMGFAVGPPRARLAVLGGGFLAITGWMLVDLFALGHLHDFVEQYMVDAGRYFREAERIAHWGQTLTQVVGVAVAALIAVMGLTLFGSWRWPRFQLALAAVPALLPAFFVVAYAAWLGYFGHNLHPWGAFTLKPFMPTVFGEGKVAQFSTHSFPHYGFALLVAMSGCLVVAVVRRRLELVGPR